MTTPRKEPEFSKILELWVASDLKVQALVFFHDNPGVIETVEGLAKRLGVNVDALRKEIAGHIALGLLQERKANGFKVLIFDRKREGDVQKAIEEHFRKLAAQKGGSA